MLVHTAPDVDTVRSHIKLALHRNIAYVYVTDDTLPNPWDSLPTFWEAEIEYIEWLNALIKGDIDQMEGLNLKMLF